MTTQHSKPTSRERKHQSRNYSANTQPLSQQPIAFRGQQIHEEPEINSNDEEESEEMYAHADTHTQPTPSIPQSQLQLVVRNPPPTASGQRVYQGVRLDGLNSIPTQLLEEDRRKADQSRR